MKNFVPIASTFILAVVFTIACMGSYYSHTRNYHMTTTDPLEPQIEYVYIESEPEIITEYVYIEKESQFYRDLPESDTFYDQDMAMREGEGEGVTGMLWIMYCMECRCEAYGLTPEEVWKSDAFSSSWNRRGKTPNDDCNEALALFEEGWIPKPLWFKAGSYHGFGTPLCEVGNHYFSMR